MALRVPQVIQSRVILYDEADGGSGLTGAHAAYTDVIAPQNWNWCNYGDIDHATFEIDVTMTGASVLYVIPRVMMGPDDTWTEPTVGATLAFCWFMVQYGSAGSCFSVFHTGPDGASLYNEPRGGMTITTSTVGAAPAQTLRAAPYFRLGLRIGGSNGLTVNGVWMAGAF